MTAVSAAVLGFRGPGQRRVRQQQFRPALTSRLRYFGYRRPSASREARSSAPWRNDEAIVQVAAASGESEENSWSRRNDTADIARQQVVTRSRLQHLFNSPYDTEIFAVLVPALLAILLDPVMVLIDTGEQGCPAWHLQSHVLLAKHPECIACELLLAGWCSACLKQRDACAAIVGRLGTLPLAAVGLSNLLFFFCTVFFSFLLVATTPRVASAVAKNELQQVTPLQLSPPHSMLLNSSQLELLSTLSSVH